LTEQLGLFRDLAQGETRKAEGIDRVKKHADPTYAAAFLAVLRRRATEPGAFTSEDITAVIGLPSTGHPSVIGALMNAEARAGIIRKTGRYVHAERPNRHAAAVAEWVGTHAR
jgi:hypothetical protein